MCCAVCLDDIRNKSRNETGDTTTQTITTAESKTTKTTTTTTSRGGVHFYFVFRRKKPKRFNYSFHPLRCALDDDNSQGEWRWRHRRERRQPRPRPDLGLYEKLTSWTIKSSNRTEQLAQIRLFNWSWSTRRDKAMGNIPNNWKLTDKRTWQQCAPRCIDVLLFHLI